MADLHEHINDQPLQQAPPPQSPSSPPSSQTDTKESVGDIIRKERIMRRITIETLAKDLRLNVNYIKALEANQYDALPPEPYVRVYLRSIAKYLMLDSNAIMRKFYESRGMTPGEYTKDTMTKLDMSKIEPERPIGPLVTIILVIGVLAAVTSYLASRHGEAMKSHTSVHSADRATIFANDTADTVVTSDVDSTIPAVEPPADTGNDTFSAPATVPERKVLSLSIEVVRDSSWVQVFSDGVSWKKTLYAGVKVFNARDSINVHVGNNKVVRYKVNGKAIEAFAESDVVVFKLSRNGTLQQWTLTQWQNVFRGRL